MSAATTRKISVRRVPSVLVSAAVISGLALSLTACGTRPGAAAVVNGRRISVTDLQDATAGLRAADPASFGKVTTAQVLSILIIGPYAEQAASAAGNGVSDDVVREAVLSQAQSGGTSDVHLDKLNAGAYQALRGEVALSALTTQDAQEALLKTIQGLHIQVSPRYGTFNRSNAAINPPAPNWLPTPKPTATASPSASG